MQVWLIGAVRTPIYSLSLILLLQELRKYTNFFLYYERDHSLHNSELLGAPRRGSLHTMRSPD